MRLQVLLLLVVCAAILHAYPQRQLDRKRAVAEQSAEVPTRGGRKYLPGSELESDAETWRSERTERREPTRGRSASRRADYHTAEPETASSVLSPVTQQLLSPRRTQQEQGEVHRSQRRNLQEEPTEPTRRRVDSGRRSRTRADVSTTESTRGARIGSRRESISSTETPRRIGGRRSGSRGTDVSTARSTDTTTTQTSTSEIPPEAISKATAAVESKEEVAASDTPNSKSQVEESSSANTKETSSQSEEIVNARKKEIFTHAEETSGSKRKESSSNVEEILSTRRTEISSHMVENTGARRKEIFSQDESLGDRRNSPEEFQSIRRKEVSNHPQETTGVRRKELFTHSEETVDIRRKRPTNNHEESSAIRNLNSSSHAEDNSGDRRGGRNGRKFEMSRSRNGGSRSEDTAASPANTREYRRREQESIDDSTRHAAVDSHVDVPRIGARQRTTTESSQDSASRKSPTRANHRGDAEGQRNVQFKPRTTPDGETSQQRSYQRNFARRGETSTTARSVTTPKTREASTRRGHFRSMDFERPKTAASFRKKNLQVVSPSEDTVQQQQEMFKNQRDSEEIQDTQVGSSSSEDSFITRSSHQVVTVTAYPHNKDQNVPSNVGKRESPRGRTKTNDLYQRVNKVESGSEIKVADTSSEVTNIRHRTANLLLAPSPPSSNAENSVEEAQRSKLLVVGGYSRLRDAANSEDNAVSTATPFSRITARSENKVIPTTARGKPHNRSYQKETTATTELQRQVPTPSSSLPPPNPTISHAGRTGFKQRFSSTSESHAPRRTSTSRKPVDSTAEPTTSTSKKFKSFKDTNVRTTPSFRRSIGSGTEDSRIPSSTTEVSLVTPQSVQSNIPRFSSRYRSDLLRATGHGLRGTTTPVYVPTVPTVRPTVSTSTTEPAFSAIGKMASDHGFTRSEVRSQWANQL